MKWNTDVKLSSGRKEEIGLSSRTISVLYGADRWLVSQWRLFTYGGLLFASTDAESKAGAQFTYKSTGTLNLGLQGGAEVRRSLSDSMYVGGDLRLRVLRPALKQLPAGVALDSSFALIPSFGLIAGVRPRHSKWSFGLRVSGEGLSFSPGIAGVVGVRL